MRLGIVSDSHGHVELTKPAVRMLESLEVDAVLHCGDIGSMDVVRLFTQWPTHFVFGNCDEDTEHFATLIQRAGQSCHGLFGDLEFEGVRVALLHSHERRRFRETIDSGEYQLICYGHTHVAAIDRHGDTVVLNPGALYRADPHSIAVVELPAVAATIVTL